MPARIEIDEKTNKLIRKVSDELIDIKQAQRDIKLSLDVTYEFLDRLWDHLDLAHKGED